MDDSRALEALSDAVLATASERSVKAILDKLVDAARELVGARYGAIGIPDGEGGFAAFVTSGIDQARIEAIGPLPRSHGMLDAILGSTESYRTDDLQGDPRYEGWWPAAHPDMHSMLGVPIVSKGTTIGAFYLTDKLEGPFTDADQSLVERFAAHAAVAIDNARFFERSRELSVIEERNRLARELHDSVTQTLFSLNLTAQAAVTLVEKDPAAAREELTEIRQLAQHAIDEMRSLVFELRPAELGSDGLVPTLRKHVDVVRRVFATTIELDVTGDRRLDHDVEFGLFRIAQEALNNALKHAGAGKIVVSVHIGTDRARVSVADDGRGFEPHGLGVRTRHLGLTSMEERALDLGAALRIDSVPARGTTVSVEVAA